MTRTPVVAHSEDRKVYRTKREFGDDFQAPVDTKFVFVMMHAFNDHPHSHSRTMIFKDYFEWVEKTLEYAKTRPELTWIFKEHPSAKYYPTKDLSLADYFANCGSNIVFLDTDAQFGATSLTYIADVVVTVAGTAGVEYAAESGIPSILAGTTMYSGFGFTIEPQTKSEYFQVLKKIDQISRLTPAQQNTVRKIFIYEWRYGDMPFSWCPHLPYK